MLSQSSPSHSLFSSCTLLSLHATNDGSLSHRFVVASVCTVTRSNASRARALDFSRLTQTTLFTRAAATSSTKSPRLPSVSPFWTRHLGARHSRAFGKMGTSSAWASVSSPHLLHKLGVSTSPSKRNPSRRKSTTFPWSKPDKPNKLKKQRPVTTGAIFDDDSRLQTVDQYSADAPTDTGDRLTSDSCSSSLSSAGKHTLISDAETGELTLLDTANDADSGEEFRPQTLAQFLMRDPSEAMARSKALDDDARYLGAQGLYGSTDGATAFNRTGKAMVARGNIPTVDVPETTNASQEQPVAETPEGPKHKSRGSDGSKSDEHEFEVQYTEAEVELIASEIYTQTVAETTLYLLVTWINAKKENYEVAKKHIRELATDRVSVDCESVLRVAR